LLGLDGPLRTLWRPVTIWNLFCASCLAAMFGAVFASVGPLIVGGVVGADLTVPALTPAALELLIVVLGTATVGTVVSVHVQDLCYCRFSWTLPSLRSGIRRSVAAIGLATAALSAVVLALRGTEHAFVGALGLGLFGFASGLVLFDAHPSRKPAWLALVLLVVATSTAPAFTDLVVAGPSAMLVVGACLAALSLAWVAAPSTLRAKALVPAEDLGASFLHPEDQPGHRAGHLDRKGIVRGWTGGAIDDTRTRVRALFYEEVGWVSGEQLGATLRIAAFAAAFVLALAFVLGTTNGGTFANGFAWMWQLVFDPRRSVEGVVGRQPTGLAASAMATGAILSGLVSRLDFRRGVHYPISRSERAEVVWQACLRQTLVLTVSLGALLLVAGFVAGLASGLDLELRRVPEVLGCLAVTAVMLPALQWVRIRLLHKRGALGDATTWTLAFAGTAAFFGAVQGLTLVGWRALDPTQSVLVLVLVLPIAFAFAQAIYKRVLTGWFATADLT
jgi:hypothetical protein